MSDWLMMPLAGMLLLVALLGIQGGKLGRAVLHLCGWPCRASTSPKAKAAFKTKIGQQRRPVRRPLPRVTGPRSALRLIADMLGQISGRRREPDARDLESAWLYLGHPAGDFVKALIGLKEQVPLFLRNDDEEAKLDELTKTAKRSPRKFIAAIWSEVPLCASREATNLLARLVRRRFRGAIPKPEWTDERQWHVVDQSGRPVICRLDEDESGRLEIRDAYADILDGQGGWLHRETIALSHWKREKGWLTGGGRIRRGNDGDGGGLPEPQPEPNLGDPQI